MHLYTTAWLYFVAIYSVIAIADRSVSGHVSQRPYCRTEERKNVLSSRDPCEVHGGPGKSQNDKYVHQWVYYK